MKDAESRRKVLADFVKSYTLSEASKILGKPDRQVNDMLAGRKSFGSKVARAMERHAVENFGKLNLFYFEGIDKDHAPHDDEVVRDGLDGYLKVPFIGNKEPIGKINQEAETIASLICLSKQWINKNLPLTGDIQKLAFTYVVGDSMQPTLNNGDMLLIDTSINTTIEDSIYALEVNEKFIIKRVRQRFDGSYEISSDNLAVKTVDILNDEFKIKVVGRAVWAWHGKRV